MSNYDNILQINSVDDALVLLRGWLKSARQQRRWTIKDLSLRSGVPESTISRLERTGLGSTDVLLKLLFAMNELDRLIDCMKAAKRVNELPVSLDDLDVSPKIVQRVRHGRGGR